MISPILSPLQLDLLDSYRYYNCKFPDPLAMELYGHTQNATYLTGPKVGSTFLPTIGNQTSSYKVRCLHRHANERTKRQMNGRIDRPIDRERERERERINFIEG